MPLVGKDGFSHEVDEVGPSRLREWAAARDAEIDKKHIMKCSICQKELTELDVCEEGKSLCVGCWWTELKRVQASQLLPLIEIEDDK